MFEYAKQVFFAPSDASAYNYQQEFLFNQHPSRFKEIEELLEESHIEIAN